jgi:AcrR family transcriptional regulator
VLATGGLRRCTVEEIAEQGRLGRTTIYRRFEGRDEIVHAVLAREVRDFFGVIAASVDHLERLEDQVVEGFLTGIRSASDSLLIRLARSEPELLGLIVTDSGPMMDLATTVMVGHLERLHGLGRSPAEVTRARAVAEILIRLALSFALMPGSSLPLDDDAASRRALHEILDPMLAPPIRTADA